jgi:hypothetical protein
MPNKTRPIFDRIADGTVQNVLDSRDPAVLLLRGHGLVEAALLTLLEGRLRVAPGELPQNLNFDRLARLALAGRRYVALLSFILELNRVRNVYAHNLEADSEKLLKAFVAKMPDSIRADSRIHGRSLPELAAASLMLILASLLRVSLEVARYRPDLS